MLYDYEKRNFKIAKTEIIKVSKDVVRTRIEYDSFIQTPYPEANKVVGYLFEPEQPKTNIPLIFLHGMGDKNLVPLSWFPHQFAKNGIPSFFMILPYHFERTPKWMKSGKKFLLDDMENTVKDFRHAVIDLRTSMDFLEVNGNYNGEFNFIGVSFGGMIGIIAMAVDERIKKAVFVVTGGNFVHITWKSLATRVLRKKYEVDANSDLYGCTEKKCIEVHKDYFDYIKKLKTLDDLENVQPTKECFLFDPLTFGHYLRRRQVIMYNALLDEVIPRQAAQELWEEMGKPERHWLFSGHATSIFYRKRILNRSLELFLS